jgi:serine/threonine-protein kinase
MNMRLGHYDIIEELGRGGMGVVYKGFESSLGRYVAIKALSAAMAHDKVFVERFLREARAMATLNDSHIIQIYFIGQDEGQTFFVMEYIDGDSLSGVLKREGKLDPADALKILLRASQGLAAAHAQGVIHRDVKPANIMITSRGQVKVADFGIALANQDADSKLTGTGQLVGTPGYLSPEVCLGQPVDARSDIFALGIVLFEMLSGRMPFEDASPLRLMLDVVQADAPDIRELVPAVDEDVANILARMLAKDPADRYQSCADLNEELRKHPLVLQGGPLKLRPSPSPKLGPSDPTLISGPTSLAPDAGMRRSTPPPIVNSGSTRLSQPSMANAMGSGTPVPAPAAKRFGRPGLVFGSLFLVAAVIGVLVWMNGRSPGPSSPATQTPVPIVKAVTPAPPTPPPAAQAEPSAPPLAVHAKPSEPPPAAPAASVTPAMAAVVAPPPKAVATVRYGHGGPNTKRNRIRVRAEVEPTAEELLAREQAREQNEAAVAAALSQQSQVAPPTAPAKPVKRKTGFMCRVFNKCDPPKKAEPAAPPPPGG